MNYLSMKDKFTLDLYGDVLVGDTLIYDEKSKEHWFPAIIKFQTGHSDIAWCHIPDPLAEWIKERIESEINISITIED